MAATSAARSKPVKGETNDISGGGSDIRSSSTPGRLRRKSQTPTIKTEDVTERKEPSKESKEEEGEEDNVVEIDAEEQLRRQQEDEERNVLLDQFILPKPRLPDASSLDPVQAFVTKAIEDQDESNEPISTYRAMVDAFRSKRDLDLLRKICLAIRRNTTALHLLLKKEKHARLIHFMVRMDPFTDQRGIPSTKVEEEELRIDLAEAHLYLLLSLVSAKSVYVVPILTSLWNRLTVLNNVEPSSSDEESSIPQQTNSNRTKRLHAAIATLLELCPKGKTELFLIISSNAPFRTLPDHVLSGYFTQALHVTQYLPEIEHRIVELLVDKCLEMDVEIKISDTGEATIEKDKDDKDEDCVFAFDEDAKQDDDAKKDEDSKKVASNLIKVPEARRSSPVKEDEKVDEMANKLDSLLFLLFQFIESRQSATDVYPVLLRVFTTSILITYKSKFVQYAIFYTLGLERRQKHQQIADGGAPMDQDHVENDDDEDDDPLYRDFCAKLVGMVVDPLLATPTRQSAACYLASLVSRASFVHAETVCETVSALLRWTEAYMGALSQASWDTLYSADSRNQSNMHSLFYTVCQAAFYIMCFRGKDAILFYRDLLADQQSVGEDELVLYNVSPLRWIGLCGHVLKPLNYCLESVRTEFLQFVTDYELLDEVTLDLIQNAEVEKRERVAAQLKRRRRVVAIRTPATLERERSSGGVGGLGRGKNPLGSFFPFDPYLLRNSHVFIEPLYIHWTGSNSAEPLEEADDDDANSTAEIPEAPKEERGGDDDGEDDNEDDPDESDDDQNDSDSDSVVDHMDIARSPKIQMSKHQSNSPTETKTREELEAIWTQTLKRTRAPSVENGSW